MASRWKSVSYTHLDVYKRQTQAGVAFQRARVDAAQGNFNRVAARIRSDLKSAYSDLMYAQENRDLARKILARRKDNLDLVELRFEGGREHKGLSLIHI